MRKRNVLIELSQVNWPEIAAQVHFHAPELADYWHVHPRRLQREFRRQLKTTPQKHLDLVRAAQIKELARQKLRTKEIRVRLEFKHSFQVCRHFIAAFGTSLKTFRQTLP